MLFREKKLSTNAKGFLLIFLVLFAFLALYFICNYNRFTLYKFSFDNGEISSDGGIAYFTPQKRSIILTNLNYKGKETLLINKISVGIYNKNKGKLTEITSNTLTLGDEAIDINEYFKTLVLNYEEKNMDVLDTKIELFFRENTYVKINITTNTGKEINYEIKINAEKYSNNKLFY